MIREFSKCGSNLERIQYLKEVLTKEHTLEDLKGICQVMSFKVKEGASKEELLAAMISELEGRLKEEGMGIHRISQKLNEMDVSPEKSSGDKLGSIKNVADALFVHEEL